MRQMGIALAMYAGDHWVYPLWGYSFTAVQKGKGAFLWYDALIPYLANARWGMGVFKCPGYSWKIFEDDRVGDGIAIGGGSYAYNHLGSDPVGAQDFARVWTGLGGWNKGNGEVALKETDVKSPSDMYAIGDAQIVQWQNGWIIGQNTYDTALFWKRMRLVKFQHEKKFNMLMVDGHVETVRTNELFSLEKKHRRRWNHNNDAPE
jgi:prepilin-type processing-associated H-X9-DG protein